MVGCSLILNFVLLSFLIILGIIFTALHRHFRLLTISNLSSLLALKLNPFSYHNCKRKSIWTASVGREKEVKNKFDPHFLIIAGEFC